MKHFKPNRTQQRMARITAIWEDCLLLNCDILKRLAIQSRLDKALRFLSSRHHKRANEQLTIALALIKGL